MKYFIFDVVTLAEDIPEHNLRAGVQGTIVDIYAEPEEAYEVEFCDEEGRAIDLLAILPKQLHPPK